MKPRQLLPVLATLALLATGACNRDATGDSAQSPDPPVVEATSAVKAPNRHPKPKPKPKPKPEPTTPKPTPTQTRTRTAEVQAGTVSADGLGPYVVGAKMSRLKAAGLLTNNYEYDACPHWAIANGTRKYGSPGLFFWHGKLIGIQVEDDSPTDQGIRVGASLSEVKDRYPAGEKIDFGDGLKGWFVRDGDHALAFLHEAGSVQQIGAGTAQYEHDGPTGTQGC